jgi:Ser/Thr protein kinase RdoA (MazF antagonist)
MSDENAARRALGHWDLADARLAALGGGLINASWRVDAAEGAFVLQQVNPIFDPAVHENIAAVTARIAAVGRPTPRLVPARDGRAWIEADGVWRVYTFVAGQSFAVVSSPAQARAAGELVGAFHGALSEMPHAFTARRLGVHDTARHMTVLEEAVAAHRAHRLWDEVSALAAEVAPAWRAASALPEVAPIVGHGDLKLANVIFAADDAARALCLVDLDTVGPIHLGHELGDMWRSWCNRAAEDEPLAALDLEVLAHSWQGWLAGIGRTPTRAEREAALAGLEIISVELCARFLADALNERYFGFDRARFSAAGEHNLARARGQWALHRAVVESRAERRAILGL